MKKILFFLLIGGSALFISSCTKQYNETTPNRVYTATVTPTQWTKTSDGKADSVSIPAQQIGNFFNESGGVLVYFSFYEGSYEQIPEVYENVSYSYYNDAGNLVLYSQTADGTTPVAPTQDIGVKLVLVAAQ
jgi:hypothetical protein